MNIEHVTNQLKTIIKAHNQIEGLERSGSASPSELGLHQFNIGTATGKLTSDFINFREQVILEAEMLEAAQALPSDAAKSILVLAVQSTAYLLFHGNREGADGRVRIPNVDRERDSQIARIKALALTLDPETLLPRR